MSLIRSARAHARRLALVVGLGTAALAGSLSPSVRARGLTEPPPPEAPGPEVQGIPWTGQPGITETVAQIMARERQAPKVRAGLPQPAKPEIELRKLLPPRQTPPGFREPMLEPTLTAPQPYNPQAVGTSFLGAQLSESGLVPPDSMGDVGPTQILVAINGRIKVFDKNGALGGLNASTNTFFNSVRNGSGTSDPHVRYDRLSSRWFITMVNVPRDGGGNVRGPNRVLIAVSSSSVITGSTSFTFFQFQQDTVGAPGPDLGGFADYPTLGVDKFALYVGVNIFNLTPGMEQFVGTTGFVVNKANVIAGGLTVTAFRQMANNGDNCFDAVPITGPVTPQGVDNDDPGATEGYFIGTDLCFFDQFQVRRVGNPGGAPTLSGNLTVGLPSQSERQPIPQVQPSTTRTLDAIDDRLFAAAIHKNKITGAINLWTAHNIQVDESGAAIQCGVPTDPSFPICPNGRNASRWYEIGSLTAAPALAQSGILFDSAASNPLGYWMPSVAMSGQGHVVIGTSRAGANPANGFAGIAVAGRLRSDPANATQGPTLAQSGAAPYIVDPTPPPPQPPPPQRWGDYSQVGVDPNDDMTMWTFQEYANAGNSYGVRAIKLIAPPPATPASASPNAVFTGQPSVNVTINGTSVAGSEFFDPGPDAGGPGFANHIAASVSGGVTVNSVTFNSPTQVTLNLSTVGASPGAKNVTITNPDGQSATGTGLLTVNIPPTLSINDVSMAEGNSGPTTFTFTVSLAPTSSNTVTVNYATADGTATAGSDYVSASGTLTFPPGTGSQPISVTVNGDNVYEPNETFTVNLSGAVNAPIGDGQGVGTIVNDDPLPGISIGDVSVAEGNSGTTNAVFNVTLSNPSSQTITVNFATADGTATSGSDYGIVIGTLTFTPGTTARTITVPVIGDRVMEANETFFVNLSAPVNATIVDGQGVGTIVDDDPAGLSINDVTAVEGTTAVFTVTLAPVNPTLTVTVSYATANGTATAGSDYVSASGTLTFPPGTATRPINVTIATDAAVEGAETFVVNLSAPVNAAIAYSQGTGTILDPGGGGDFNADGKPDILWRNQASGDNLVWFMNGTTITGGAVLTAIADTNWNIVGTADFNADGKTDILWRHQVSGDNLVWFMNGTTITGGAVLTAITDTSWRIVATGDFNADGKPDILWRNQASGDNLVWFMNGTTITGGAVLTAVTDVSWRIAGVGDFNADGKPDILWRNQASGDNLVWFMNGTTITGGAVLTSVSDVNWVVGGIGDFNADGKPDIVWRNQASGDNLVWFMNGTTISGGAVLTSIADTNWRIVGPR